MLNIIYTSAIILLFPTGSNSLVALDAAEEGQFPFIVFVMSSRNGTGIILHPHFVLTAAHAVTKSCDDLSTLDDAKIVGGLSQIPSKVLAGDKLEGTAQIVYSSKFYLHPNYYGGLTNDLCLIFVTIPFDLKQKNIGFVKLFGSTRTSSQYKTLSASNCIVVAWASESYHVASTTLFFIHTPIESGKTCPCIKDINIINRLVCIQEKVSSALCLKKVYDAVLICGSKVAGVSISYLNNKLDFLERNIEETMLLQDKGIEESCKSCKTFFTYTYYFASWVNKVIEDNVKTDDYLK